MAPDTWTADARGVRLCIMYGTLQVVGEPQTEVCTALTSKGDAP